MSIQAPGVMIYFETKEMIGVLNYKQKGMLLEAILEYGSKGTFPDFQKQPALMVAWVDIRQKIDKDMKRYKEKVEKNRDAANKRWDAEKTFTPPTLEEVREYCYEKQIAIDPDLFWDYYNAGGWIAANGNPIKNWKSQIKVWEAREQDI